MHRSVRLRTAIALATKTRSFRADYRTIESSGLFDEGWYRERAAMGRYPFDAICHYLERGAKAGLEPNPLFDSAWVARDGLAFGDDENIFARYLRANSETHRRPGPLFDTAWYQTVRPDIPYSGLDAFSYYQRVGRANGDATTPYFDRAWYLRENPDVVPGAEFDHYLRYGRFEARDPNALFDHRWYVNHHGPLPNDALSHFADMSRNGRQQPSPLFDSAGYLNWYRSIVRSDEPLRHYLSHGINAGMRRHDLRLELPETFRVAIVCHVYYLDLWPEIVSFLKNMPVAYDLYITTPRRLAEDVERCVRSDVQDAIIIPCVDGGRDIGPFFEALAGAYHLLDYDALCKIHTKKGVTQPVAWRHCLLRSVLGERDVISDILISLHTHEELAMVGARSLFVSGKTFIGPNRPWLTKIMAALDVEEPTLDWGFFAGSMFWIKPNTLSALVRYVRDNISFNDDNTSNDGQIAHALERAIGLVAASKTHRTGLVDTDAHPPPPTRLRIVDAGQMIGHEELANYLKRCADAVV